MDVVFGQRLGRFNLRLNLENLTDSDWLFSQGVEGQRRFRLGRTVAFSVGMSVF